eukprot:TRINITY_DN429_c0_g1_i1.p1 TRINITY_DN429_c0_g1~~TRINITY_DN429_c0_g1_i1.p1  ORF type:complete len:420 (+),score=108.41 TRINITY_DN429_c0_g1_i1:1569-2828(+)
MSVNGRPFRPDPNAYSETGVPCGNPKKYLSRSVLRMVPNPEVPFEDLRWNVPGKGTQTKAEDMFNEMMKNQLDTSSAQANRKVAFASSSHKEDFGLGSKSGMRTLQEYIGANDSVKRIADLRDRGFNDNQIEWKLKQEGHDTEKLYTQQLLKRPRFMPHPDHIKREVLEMDEKISHFEQGENGEDDSTVKLSRHASQIETSLLRAKGNVPLAFLFDKTPTLIKPTGAVDESEGAEPKMVPISLPSHPIVKSEDEKKEIKKQVIEKRDDEEKPNTTQITSQNKSQNQSESASEKKGESTQIISGGIQAIPLDTIESNKAPNDEILKKFPHYEKGTVSNILYLKNLDPTVTVEDLISIFMRFQDISHSNRIQYKGPLTGRMKGQAFITFPSEEVAAKALDLVHGFNFKGKPIVIQFGKAKN